jgi:hypothetical protein
MFTIAILPRLAHGAATLLTSILIAAVLSIGLLYAVHGFASANASAATHAPTLSTPNGWVFG